MTGGNVTINQLTTATSVALTDIVPIQSPTTGSVTRGATVSQILAATNAISHGRIYVSSSATTTLTTQNTYYKVAGTTTLAATPLLFDMPTDNRLRFTGTQTNDVFVNVSLSWDCSTNNQLIGYQIWFFDSSVGSGSFIPGSLMARTSQTAGTIVTNSLTANQVMDTNDYLEIHVSNLTSGGKTLTVDYMSFLVHGVVE